MQNEFTPEPPNTPQTIQTEAAALAARRAASRLKAITNQAISAKRQKRRGLDIVGYVLVTSPFLLLFFYSSSHADSAFFPVLFLTFFIICFTALVASSGTNGPAFNIAELAREGGIKAIPPLLATLQTPQTPKQQQALRDALTLLLPQMKASDAHLLTSDARRTILLWLNNANSYATATPAMDALRIAALKALEQVGDSSMIPTVERLAQMTPRTTSEEKIKQAAIECLPLLRANCQDIDAARTLLRASQAEPTDPATLLRPASHAPQTNPVELLRGSHSPDA